MAEALYRKYRPQVFEDVVGQEPIERTLKNAIAQDKLSHAYLFTGPRGTGKTTTARLLAKALLCEGGPTPEPDGTCEDCQLIAEGTHPDVYELDAASRTGVDNVREEIIGRVQFAPTRGRYKVYIIDEVHMLSMAAFNSLLKTLEEPPGHVVFILCTTDPQKVPDTVHSRCQRFDFRRIAPESMVARLGAICMAEGVQFEGEALDLIAQRAEGGLRNALTSLEQIIAFEGGSVTMAGAERLLGSIDSTDMAEIVSYIGKRDIANCLRWTASYVETGADLAQFVRDMAEHVRNLYVMALVGDDADIDVTETQRHQLAGELAWFGPDRASRLLGVLGDLMAEMKTSSNQRLSFEIALTRMVRPDSDLTLEALAERVEALENGYSSVAHVLPGPAYRGEEAVQSAAPAQSARAAQPVQPVQALQHAAVEQQARDAQAAQVVQTVRSAQPVEGAQPAQASQPIREAQPVQQAQPAQQAQPSQFAQPVQAAQPVQSAQYVQGAQPMQSGEPVQRDSGFQAAQPAQTQPAQQATSDAGDASLLANPAALQRIWRATLSAVKKQKQAYSVLFMGTKVRFDEGSAMVVVNFPAESTFAFNAAQKPDVQAVVEEALAKSAGMPVAFCFEQGSTTVHVTPAETGFGQRADASPSIEPPAETRQETPVQPFGQPAERRPQPAPEDARFEQPRREQPQASAPQASASQAPAPQPSASQAPVPQGNASYETVPYEEVPYDDVVPYEDFGYYPDSDAGYGGGFESRNSFDANAGHANARGPESGFGGDSAAPFRPNPDGAVSNVPMTQPKAAVIAPGAGGEPPQVAPSEGAAEPDVDVAALLRESFGGGVVFTEVDD